MEGQKNEDTRKRKEKIVILYLSSDFFEKLLIFFTVAKKQVDALCESQFHFCKKNNTGLVGLSMHPNGRKL